MNFHFQVGDVVRWRSLGENLELVKEFVRGVFHAKSPSGTLYRVRARDLVRIRRPSDDAKRVEVEVRKARRAFERGVKADRVEKNQEEFASMTDFKVRLTKDGLPDKRCKPKFSAKNSPQGIKPRPRSNLL